jgi:hypothetical protein
VTTWFLYLWLAGDGGVDVLGRFTSHKSCEEQARQLFEVFPEYYVWHVCVPHHANWPENEL